MGITAGKLWIRFAACALVPLAAGLELAGLFFDEGVRTALTPTVGSARGL